MGYYKRLLLPEYMDFFPEFPFISYNIEIKNYSNGNDT